MVKPEIELISEIELKQTINSMKLRKTPCKDKKTVEMVKYNEEKPIDIVFEIMNFSFRSKHIENWTTGFVLSIYNNGDEKECCMGC